MQRRALHSSTGTASCTLLVCRLLFIHIKSLCMHKYVHLSMICRYLDIFSYPCAYISTKVAAVLKCDTGTGIHTYHILNNKWTKTMMKVPVYCSPLFLLRHWRPWENRGRQVLLLERRTFILVRFCRLYGCRSHVRDQNGILAHKILAKFSSIVSVG
jgi:hypothetical protein